MSTTTDRAGAPWARGVVALLILLPLLAACTQPTPPDGTGTGTVAGEVIVGPSSVGAAQTGLALDPVGRDFEQLDFMPGELIVAFEPALQRATVSELRVAGVTLNAVRPLGIEGAALYRTSAGSLAELLEIAASLEARPNVRYAHPNYLLQPALAPNDPEYDRQWHYQAIDMEGAWDITTGSAAVTVAVVDSGILYSQSNASLRHPDLVGRVLPGYDFISDAVMANDGDGRDAEPYDTVPQGDYHGTHVAGTIGAATNNGQGVAGVDWHAKLLPVRVLGANGGAIADIADAIRWAAGGSVPGVPNNPNPADVINLSLGGASDQCYGALFDAITAASDSAIIVAAAGNANKAASGFTPANCPGPIVVGGTDRNGDRAWYSNYGARVDVMAPGGDISARSSDGILSTGGDDGYVFMQGTSMAAPHVSGLISLMLAEDPTVTDVVALELLRASATPLSDAECDGQGAPDRDLHGFDCGAGLIDARVALDLIGSDEPPPPVEEGVVLTFDPPVLDLGASRASATFTLTNSGDATAEWKLIGYYEQASDIDNPGPVPAGVVSAEVVGEDSPPGADFLTGTLEPQESVQIRFFIDRDLLEVDGFYAIEPIFEADGEQFLYQVRFARQGDAEGEVLGPMVVAAFKEDPNGGLYTSGSQTSDGVITNFEFQVESGRNLLGAWSDENDSGKVDEGDYLGYRDQYVDVPAGARVAGLDITVQPVVGSTRVPDHVREAMEGMNAP